MLCTNKTIHRLEMNLETHIEQSEIILRVKIEK